MKTTALLTLAACLLALPARADDWPQFRGPNRDGVSKETGLLKTWPAGGPKLAWTYKDAGTGYSGPAIVGDLLYTCGARGPDEYVFALDLTQNPPVELWKVKLGPTFTWKGNTWSAGPLVTPTVDGDLVFALGGGGDLVCVDAKAQKEKWRCSLVKNLNGKVYDYGGVNPGLGWGFACAPLVDSDQVICVPGGKDGMLAALNKKTGERLWQSKALTGVATYASPVIATIAGTKQYLQMTEQGVASVDPTGQLLWYYKRENPYEDIVGCSPLVKGDHVFISGAGGGAGGCDLIEIKKVGEKFEAKMFYAKKDLANYHGGLVLVGDYVYGASGVSFKPGPWVCMEFATGKVTWTPNNRRIGIGAVTAADGYLYCTGEGTDLVVRTPADPDKKLTIAESFKLPAISALRKSNGAFWTHPVIANGKLYLRDQELLYCYEVK